MKEEIVTFETAKLAEEVGFQNKTPHKLRKNYYNYLGELNGDSTAYIKRFTNEEDTSDFVNVEAPTQSLLQRWLREVHNIEVEVSKMWHFSLTGNKERDKKTFYRVTVCNFELPRDKCIIYIDDVGDYNHSAYEEALEVGLQEALKLIKQ